MVSDPDIPFTTSPISSCFFNQSLRTTREDLIRSVYEGVAYNSRWLLERLEHFTRRRLDDIRMIGGGAKSDVWCQIYADVLNRTIKQLKEPVKANLRGAAFLASVALGHIEFSDIPECVEVAKTFKPSPENRRLYDELFAIFKEVYKRNKAVYEKLNRV